MDFTTLSKSRNHPVAKIIRQ